MASHDITRSPALRKRRILGWGLSLCTAFLAACGGGEATIANTGASLGGAANPASYTIGGTITGLAAPGLVLQDNAGDNLTIANGSNTFTFATALTVGAGYGVTLLTQPGWQTCTVSNGSGAASANVTSVNITCAVAPQYVKISSTGTPLASSATAWCAVQDTVHHLMWQNFQTALQGSAAYTNYFAGYGGSSVAVPNDAADYVTSVNNASLCGFANWRMPTGNTGGVPIDLFADGGELDALVLGTTAPTINTSYFSNTSPNAYWTSTGTISNATIAWYVDFFNASISNGGRGSYGGVRLVRASP